MSTAKTIFAVSCPICCKPAHSPFRAFDAAGKVIHGCVDEFHTGQLMTPSESARWHGRPAAIKLRVALKRAAFGWVTKPAVAA